MNGEVFADAEVEIFDGSTIIEYAWTQTGTTPAAIAGEDTDMVVLGLADRQTYSRAAIRHVLSEPPITADQLPENVPLPRRSIARRSPGSFRDRGHESILARGDRSSKLEVEVTTTSGAYTEDVEVHTALPWKPAAGIHNVPVHPRGPERQGGARLQLVAHAAQRLRAVLIDGDTRNPEFTPDRPGKYASRWTAGDR